MCSCTEEIGVEYSGRPIVFSQELGVESRTGKLSVLNSKSFGVRGYKYDAEWWAEEPKAVPDSQWLNTEVQCDVNGICTYAPLQQWETKKRYAFFGYYPYCGAANDLSNGTVSLSGETAMGPPTLTYTLNDQALGINQTDTIGDFNAMYDVMYGNVTDANEKETSSVELVFKHALSAIQIFVENLHTETVYIEELKVQLNVLYRTVKIHMNDGTMEKVGFDAVNTPQKVKYTYVLKNNDLPVEIPSTLNFSPVNISKEKNLLLIPQDVMTGKIWVDIKSDAVDYIPFEMDMDFSKLNMKPGEAYAFSLQLMGKTANLIVIEKTGWVDKNTGIEFE